MMIDIGQIIFSPSMRTAHTFRRCAAEKIRIGFAQHKLPGATIERIINSATAEVGET